MNYHRWYPSCAEIKECNECGKTCECIPCELNGWLCEVCFNSGYYSYFPETQTKKYGRI